MQRSPSTSTALASRDSQQTGLAAMGQPTVPIYVTAPHASSEAAEELPALDLKLMALSILRRWWIIALAFILGVGLAVAYLLTAKPVFRSTASVEVKQQNRQIMPEFSALRTAVTQDIQSLNTLEGILNSQAIYRRIMGHPEFAPNSGFFPKVEPGSTPLTEAQQIKYIQRRYSAGLARGTRLLEVHTSDHDPARAALLAQTAVDEFLVLQKQRITEDSEQAHTMLQERAKDIRLKLSDSERKLSLFLEKNHDLPLDGRGDKHVLLASGSGFDHELSQAQSDSRYMRTELDSIKDQLKDSPEAWLLIESIAQNGGISSLRTQLDNEAVNFEEIKTRYLEKHPSFIAAKKRVEELKVKLHDQLAIAGASFIRGLEALESKENQLGGLRTRYNEALSEYQDLTRELDQNRTIFAALSKRIEETEVFRHDDSLNIEQVTFPIVAAKQTSPKKTVTLALGGIAGLGMGTALALLFSLTDNRLGRGALPSGLNTTSLHTIPSARGLHEDELLMNSLPRSDAAEAFRYLRSVASPLAAMGNASAPGGGTILFTSPDSGAGTTFCASNFAATLAQQGYRTVLVELDFEGAYLHRTLLNTSLPVAGIADSALGYRSDNLIQPTAIPDLFFIDAGSDGARSQIHGGIPENYLTRFLEDAREFATFVVIDAPALDRSSSALCPAGLADITILTTWKSETKASSLTSAVKSLEMAGAPSVQFITNKHQPGFLHRLLSKTGQQREEPIEEADHHRSQQNSETKQETNEPMVTRINTPSHFREVDTMTV